jgi:hypothetical protein
MLYVPPVYNVTDIIRRFPRSTYYVRRIKYAARPVFDVVPHSPVEPMSYRTGVKLGLKCFNSFLNVLHHHLDLGETN